MVSAQLTKTFSFVVITLIKAKLGLKLKDQSNCDKLQKCKPD